MHTLILAIINSKYRGNYEGVFAATLVIDLACIIAFVFLFQMFYKG